MSERAAKTWFITGVSSGLGREWAIGALERGDRVAAAVRSPEAIDDLVTRFGALLFPLRLDVTDRAGAFDAIALAQSHFGVLDVVVNNAGYGMFGMIEETSEAEARAQFDTNVFGTLWVTQAALPVLRAQAHGHIIQISSVAGLTSFAGLGLYAASKWALEGMTQALAAEVAEFGITVTLVEPGAYRTGGDGREGRFATPMPAYDDLRARSLRVQTSASWGDPSATRAAMLALADAPEPPLRLFLGQGPFAMISAEYADRVEVWRSWQDVSNAATGRAL